MQTPPVAKKQPKLLKIHGHERLDPYFWLRDDDRQDPAVIKHLEAENAYALAQLEPYKKLRATLEGEMIGRMRPHIESVPYFNHGYWYGYKFTEGKEYPVYERSKDGKIQEAIFDCNQRAADQAFYSLGDIALTPDQDIMAFSEDLDGSRRYTLRFKNLTTGEILPDQIENISSFAWASDNKTIFYVKNHPKTLLPDTLYRHRLGSNVKSDALIYKEKDTAFGLTIDISESERYLILSMHATLVSEAWLLRRDDPEGSFKVFWPRSADHEYHLDHCNEHFYVLSNKFGKNFGLGRLEKESVQSLADLECIIAAREDVMLGEYYVLNNWLIYEEVKSGLARLRYMDLTQRQERAIEFSDGVYSVWISGAQNHFDDPNYNIVRVGYASLSTPDSVFEVDLTTGKRTLLQQSEIVDSFDSSLYHTERVWIKARDNTEVPVSVVYRKNLCKKDGSNPILIYGYGAYGHCIEPAFDNEAISLLDRGFVYAIAHVRGGEELGRDWYDNGRLQKKKNSFTDFIDATKSLTALGYCAKDKIFAMGASAGGLLMAAVLNEEPSLYRGVICGVPFVDCLTTMLDDTLPLTSQEYEEWGNPNIAAEYHYIHSYSPYDQIKAQAYPSIYVSSSLNDSQVGYWEPAKWVAKMRDMKTDKNPLLFHCDLETGHSGKSGRYKMYEDVSLEFAFILWILERAV